MRKSATHLTILIFTIVCFNTHLYSQSKNKFGITAAINSTGAQVGEPEHRSWGYAYSNIQNIGHFNDRSFSLSAIPKYALKNDIIIRCELMFTQINIASHMDPSQNSVENPGDLYPISDHRIKQQMFRISPGVQCLIIRKKYFEFNGGAFVSFSKYADMHYWHKFEHKRWSDDVTTEGARGNATGRGGFSTGVGAFAGFNVYLGKHIAIGAESSFALSYYQLGGKFTDRRSEFPDYSIQTLEYISKDHSYKGFVFSKVIPSFNVSFWF